MTDWEEHHDSVGRIWIDSLKFSRLFPLPEGKRGETAEFQTIGLISTGDMISLSLVVSPTRWSWQTKQFKLYLIFLLTILL